MNTFKILFTVKDVTGFAVLNDAKLANIKFACNTGAGHLIQVVSLINPNVRM
jgi:hypothetical protein